MTDKVEDIREKHLRDELWRYSPSMICPQAHDDRATLLAEIDRLRAEVERLTGIAKQVAETLSATTTKMDRLDKDNARLSHDRAYLLAENDRLRAPLRWYAFDVRSRR